MERIIIEAQSQKIENTKVLSSENSKKHEKLDNSQMKIKSLGDVNTQKETSFENSLDDVEMTDLSSLELNIKIEKSDINCDNNESFGNDNEINVDPRTYCKLGHFHLLLEDYSKGELTIFKKKLNYIQLFYIFLPLYKRNKSQTLLPRTSRNLWTAPYLLGFLSICLSY